MNSFTNGKAIESLPNGSLLPAPYMARVKKVRGQVRPRSDSTSNGSRGSTRSKGRADLRSLTAYFGPSLGPSSHQTCHLLNSSPLDWNTAISRAKPLRREGGYCSIFRRCRQVSDRHVKHSFPA